MFHDLLKGKGSEELLPIGSGARDNDLGDISRRHQCEIKHIRAFDCLLEGNTEVVILKGRLSYIDRGHIVSFDDSNSHLQIREDH
jgi:hypothetical protein